MKGSPILVHVGYPKTGTTWLQTTLFSEPVYGFAPILGSPKAGAEALNPWARSGIVGELTYDPESARRTILNGAPISPLVPVISDEGLLSHPFNGGVFLRGTAERIKSVLPEAKILITIREQRRIFASIYEHYTRKGGIATVEGFAIRDKEMHIPFFDFGYLEFDRVAGLYVSLFGESNVLVLPMECLSKDRASFCRRIVEFAGARPQRALSVLNASECRNVTDRSYAATLHYCRLLNLFARPSNLNGRGGFARRNYGPRLAHEIAKVLPKTIQWAHERRINAVYDAHGAVRMALSNSRLQAYVEYDLTALGYDVRCK